MVLEAPKVLFAQFKSALAAQFHLILCLIRVAILCHSHFVFLGASELFHVSPLKGYVSLFLF